MTDYSKKESDEERRRHDEEKRRLYRGEADYSDEPAFKRAGRVILELVLSAGIMIGATYIAFTHERQSQTTRRVDQTPIRALDDINDAAPGTGTAPAYAPKKDTVLTQR